MKKNSEPYSNFRTGKRTLCNDHLWLFFFLLRQMFLWNSLTLFHMVSFFFYWLLLDGSEDDLRLYTTVWQQAPNYTSSVSHFLVTCFVWLLGKQSYFGCIDVFLFHFWGSLRTSDNLYNIDDKLWSCFSSWKNYFSNYLSSLFPFFPLSLYVEGTKHSEVMAIDSALISWLL